MNVTVPSRPSRPSGPFRPSGVSGPEDAWTRATLGWHLAFALFALVAAVLVIVEDAPTARRAGALALIAALVAWYLATGRRVIHLDPVTRLGQVYVWVAMPLVIATMALTPVGSVLLFGMYPQIWSMLPTRRAVLASILLTAAVSLVIATAGGLSPASVGTALVMIVLGPVVSLLLGLWITRIIDQSRERARLVRELEATQAELAAVSHDAGALAERERLARDLHDSLGQGFTSTLLLLAAAQSELDRDTAACAAHLAMAERATRENLAELRALVAALTPVALADATLPAALSRLTERVGRELGVAATVSVAGEHRALPPALEVALLRSTQEALANVGKHAAAGRVDVELGYLGDRVTLKVADDGRGLDPTAPPGYGLQGLRDRLGALGGSLALCADPGVTLVVDLPYPAAAAP